MDTFMDKLAQKLNAQEMIKANSAADAEEMDQLKSQLREYDECLAQMQQVNKELKAINQEMEKLVSETIAPEVTKLSGKAWLPCRSCSRRTQRNWKLWDSSILPNWKNCSRVPRCWTSFRSMWMRN